MSTKQGNAITPTRMFKALAMDLYGPNIGFGLTPAQAIAPSYTGQGVRIEISLGDGTFR